MQQTFDLNVAREFSPTIYGEQSIVTNLTCVLMCCYRAAAAAAASSVVILFESNVLGQSLPKKRMLHKED
jgi:hypothetical protein